MFTKCRFCHKRVPNFWIKTHERKHTVLNEDGQMTDHISEPVEKRYQGSLAGVPQVYRHQTCGRRTGMPEKITRSYLANPFMYSDCSFCTGCGDYVPCRELFWVETGECVQDYYDRLREEYRRRNG